MVKPILTVRGVKVFKDWIDPATQSALASDIREIVSAAPLFSPMTPFGRPMSVRMTSAGRLGWYAGRGGYRYQATHPNGQRWPDIPPSVLEIWNAVTELDRAPDCCLVNFYSDKARMGLHQDKDEVDFSWPVVSISLGDEALFRIGGLNRRDPTESIWLNSGDVVVMGGEARLAFHGIDRTRPGSSRLLPKGGRLNLTLRVVDL